MFNNKRERTLEEELLAVKRQNDRRNRAFWDICGQRDKVEEQFARLTASRAQMEKDMEEVTGLLSHIAELAQTSTATAGDVHGVMMEINNAVESFDANHSVFVGKVKKQNEKVTELVDKNKQLLEPVQQIAEVPEAFQQENLRMQEKLDAMAEYSKSMGVLALNAAIEAGRMGEGGSRFIAAAEEIRSLSERYEEAAEELAASLKQSNARAGQLLDRTDRLRQVQKENGVAVGKLYSESVQNMASYEAGQLELRGVLSDSVIGKADALLQSERETAEAQEKMLEQMERIRREFGEQKECEDELESICRLLQKTAEKEIGN